MLTRNDFSILPDLWNQERYLDVAAQLKEWEKEEKDKASSILFEIWVSTLFRSRKTPSKAFEFESAVKSAFEESDFITERRPIIDFIAFGKEGIFAVECKNGRDRSKIYEGISQLLHYRWLSGDTESSLLLVIPEMPRRSAETLSFARSLGVDIWW